MEPEPTLRLLSLGAGVQSTALFLLSARGDLPKLDGAIFSDTGWEPAAVYAHLDELERRVAKPAGIPIHRVSNGNIRADALDPTKRFASMPLFVRNEEGGSGMVRRQCTGDYKLAPIKKQTRALLGYPHPKPVPKGVFVDQWIGISRDEWHRAKTSDVKYARNVFPLLDHDLTRTDCQKINVANGFDQVAKSACIGCPFHGNRQWRDLRDNHPDEWADAVAFDKAIRNGSARANAEGSPLRGSMYLHRSMVPLDEAPIDKITRGEHKENQLDIFEAIADAEEEVTGCSPFGCRADEGDLPWIDVDDLTVR